MDNFIKWLILLKESTESQLEEVKQTEQVEKVAYYEGVVEALQLVLEKAIEDGVQ